MAVVCLPPPQTKRILPVTPLAWADIRKAAALPNSSMVTLRSNCRWWALQAGDLPKLQMPEAAIAWMKDRKFNGLSEIWLMPGVAVCCCVRASMRRDLPPAEQEPKHC